MLDVLLSNNLKFMKVLKSRATCIQSLNMSALTLHLHVLQNISFVKYMHMHVLRFLTMISLNRGSCNVSIFTFDVVLNSITSGKLMM